jgi:hypothetical protein
MTHPSHETAPTTSGTAAAEEREIRERGAGATLLFLAGLASAGAGAAFVAAPHVSWQLTKIARAAAELGIASGELLIGGAVLLAASSIARSLSRTRSAAEQAAESGTSVPQLSLVSEQIALDLARVSGNLEHVSRQVEEIAQAQHATLAAQSRRGGPTGQTDVAEGLFRLAASLDQLHARVDERFLAIHGEFLARIDRLAQQVAEARQSTEARLVAVSASLISSPLARGPFAPEPERSPAARRPDPLEVVAELERRTAADESAIEFFETLEQLDALAGGQPTDAPSAPIDFDGMDLGDLGLRKPAPGQQARGTSPSAAAPAEPQLRAPLPHPERAQPSPEDPRSKRFLDEQKRA